MSGFADYEHYDALGLAELVRRKQITPDGSAGSRDRARGNTQSSGERGDHEALRSRPARHRAGTARRAVSRRAVSHEGSAPLRSPG